MMPIADDETITIAAQTTIFRRGDVAECAYFIEDGSIEVGLEGADGTFQHINTLEAGDIFGEMAIVDSGPRCATAVARTASRLLPIRADRLTRFLERADPIVRLVVTAMLARLRRQMTLASTLPLPSGAISPHDATAAELERAARHATTLRAISQIRRENDLKRAIERREIGLFYQPVVSLSDCRIVGFEALARWHHPERGVLPPSEFIALAEASGLIGELTRHCLGEAVASLPALSRIAQPICGKPPFVSVNVSTGDLGRENFADFLETMVRASPCDPSRLKIEITESALMENPDIARRTLQRCRKMGIGVAVDDFGTGYSSLAYLHDLPIDLLKIDRSFVSSIATNPQSQKIVRTIIRLADELDLPVVCEGIEFAESIGVLRAMGCQFAQGFHFARPMPLRDVADLVDIWGHTLRAA